MRISVPYGDHMQEAYVNEDVDVQVIDVPFHPVSFAPRELIQNAMDHPEGTPLLEQMVSLSDRIVILMNDQTRPGPNDVILDEIMKRLETAGIKDEQIQVVIATGTHRGPTREELEKIMGEAYVGRLQVHIHDSLDGDHVYMGKTDGGLPVWIDRRVAEADFVIATGLIAPHHTAGFSGGRKSIVPGVSGMETLKMHHSLPIRPYEPSMGMMEGNPFHLAALEAARYVKVRFIVNVVQDAYKQTIECVAGDMELAHQKGTEVCRRANMVQVPELADVVVTSPGGAPRDCNLYQSQKAISSAELFAKKEGAKFILCARAEDGIGGALLKSWLEEARTPEEVIERFRREGFQGGNNKAFMFARALVRGEIIVVSEGLDPRELEQMMISWAPDLQTAIDRVVCPGMRMIVLPRAVNLIPVVGKA